MRISDWSSDVCSSDLGQGSKHQGGAADYLVLYLLPAIRSVAGRSGSRPGSEGRIASHRLETETLRQRRVRERRTETMSRKLIHRGLIVLAAGGAVPAAARGCLTLPLQDYGRLGRATCRV